MIWLVAGIVTGFFYWMSFVKDVSNVYNERRIGVLKKLTAGDAGLAGSEKWSARALAVIAKVLAVGYDRNTNVFKEFVATNDVELTVPKELRSFVKDTSLPNVLAGIDWSSTIEDLGAAPQMPPAARGVEDWDSRAERERAMKAYDAAILRHTFGKASTQAELLDKLEAAVRELLPPRAGSFKPAILFAAAVWPITALSLIFADMLRHLWDWAFERARAFFDFCSRKAFGEV